MSVISIGGGPRQQARIVVVYEIPEKEGDAFGSPTYEIRDGSEVLASCGRISHAKALLPLIQSGQ